MRVGVATIEGVRPTALDQLAHMIGQDVLPARCHGDALSLWLGTSVKASGSAESVLPSAAAYRKRVLALAPHARHATPPGTCLSLLHPVAQQTALLARNFKA